MLRRDAGGGGALHRAPIEITVNDVPDAYGSCAGRSFGFLRVIPAGGIRERSVRMVVVCGARNIVSRDGPQDKPAGAIKFDRECPQ